MVDGNGMRNQDVWGNDLVITVEVETCFPTPHRTYRVIAQQSVWKNVIKIIITLPQSSSVQLIRRGFSVQGCGSYLTGNAIRIMDILP